MAHLAGKSHFVDKRLLGRVNSAIIVGVIGCGLAACVIGAAVYDVSRWVSMW